MNRAGHKEKLTFKVMKKLKISYKTTPNMSSVRRVATAEEE